MVMAGATNIASASCFVTEALYFVDNKIKAVPYDILAHICTDFYEEAEIKLAKDLLFSSAFVGRDKTEVPQNISCRGDSRKMKNI